MHKYSLKNQDCKTRFAKKDLFIAACVPDEMYKETVDDLLAKKAKLHI